MAFYWYSDLILHTQRLPAHKGANRLTHPYEYILTLPVMYSQHLSVLHWMNNLLISKYYFAELKKLLACRSQISFD